MLCRREKELMEWRKNWWPCCHYLILSGLRARMNSKKMVEGEIDSSIIPKGYQLQQGILLKKGRKVVLAQSLFKTKILHYICQDPLAGHTGNLKHTNVPRRILFGKEWRMILKGWCRNLTLAKISRMRPHTQQACYNPCPFPNKFG